MDILERVGPWSRLAALVLLIFSFSLARDPATAASTALLLACVTLFMAKPQMIRLVITVILPFGVLALLASAITANMNSVGVSRPLAAGAGASVPAYAALFFKVSGVCTSITLLIGTLSPPALFRWLTEIRLPDRIAVYCSSPLVLVKGLFHNTQTILEARLSQGCVRNRNVFAVAKQLLPVLAALISSALTTALDRSDAWRRDDIFLLMAKARASRDRSPSDRVRSGFILATACLIAIANIIWPSLK